MTSPQGWVFLDDPVPAGPVDPQARDDAHAWLSTLPHRPVVHGRSGWTRDDVASRLLAGGSR